MKHNYKGMIYTSTCTGLFWLSRAEFTHFKKLRVSEDLQMQSFASYILVAQLFRSNSSYSWRLNFTYIFNFILDRNATLDRKDHFARDFNIWDANKDGFIDLQEVI